MRILVVEDEPSIAAQLSEALTAAGYAVDVADNGVDAHWQAVDEGQPFDAVVLDLGLPQMDGLTVLKKWRAAGRSMPVPILTARDNWHEKVAGIDAGADDYLTKPFGVGELRARVRAMLRRNQIRGNAGALHAFGDVEADLARHVIQRAGAEVHLTLREYNLLVQLLSNPGRVLTHGFLIDKVWGPANREKNHYLRIYVGRLRQKLETDPTRPRHILTETGVGYRFQP